MKSSRGPREEDNAALSSLRDSGWRKDAHSVKSRGGVGTMSEQGPIGKEKKQAGPKPRGTSWRVLLGAQRCILPHGPQLITMAKQERRTAVGTGQSQRPA